jgi:hypothetical protein
MAAKASITRRVKEVRRRPSAAPLTVSGRRSRYALS